MRTFRVISKHAHVFVFCVTGLVATSIESIAIVVVVVKNLLEA